jgi:hypothetical protein
MLITKHFKQFKHNFYIFPIIGFSHHSSDVVSDCRDWEFANQRLIQIDLNGDFFLLVFLLYSFIYSRVLHHLNR